MKQLFLDERSDCGAIIVEGALSLTLFMFAVLTVYTMIHVTMAQARIGAALNSVAKEISQYSYLYDLTGANEAQAKISSKTGAAESVLSDNLNDLNSFYQTLGGLGSAFTEITSSADNTESFLYYVLNKGLEAVKGELAGEAAKLLMKKHFGSDPDGYLKKLGVVDGVDGLNMSKTRLFADGTESNIVLDVCYEVTVVKLLNIDYTFSFEQSAWTRAWVGDD